MANISFTNKQCAPQTSAPSDTRGLPNPGLFTV